MPLYSVKLRETRIRTIILAPGLSAESVAARILKHAISREDEEDVENGLVKIELLGVAEDDQPMPEPPEDTAALEAAFPLDAMDVSAVRQEIADLKARVAELEAQVAELETPDMFWDEPECSASPDASSLLIEAWRSAAEHAGEVGEESGPALVKMDCARSLPTRWGVAWSESGLIQEETFLSRAAAMEKLKALEAGGAHETAS